MKTSENQRFPDVFRGYRNEILAWKGLIQCMSLQFKHCMSLEFKIFKKSRICHHQNNFSTSWALCLSGLGTCIACKRFAVQTLLWSLELLTLQKSQARDHQNIKINSRLNYLKKYQNIAIESNKDMSFIKKCPSKCHVPHMRITLCILPK